METLRKMVNVVDGAADTLCYSTYAPLVGGAVGAAASYGFSGNPQASALTAFAAVPCGIYGVVRHILNCPRVCEMIKNS